MKAEPQLQELSAYLDQELTGSARQELEGHLATCETCRRRLDMLRTTVQAVKTLPMEVPPRAFTIPAQRQQPAQWAPLAWAGGAAAAALLLVVVALNSHGPGGAGSTTSGSVPNAPAYSQAAPAGPAGGRALLSQSDALFPNATWVGGEPHGLRLATDYSAYGPTGTMRIRVILSGLPAQATNSKDAGLQLLLVSTDAGSNGPGRVLPVLVGTPGSNGGTIFDGTYALDQAGLDRLIGGYRLIAIWTLPGSSGSALVAEVRVFVTRS